MKESGYTGVSSKKRDIHFSPIQQLEWDQTNAAKSLQALSDYSFAYAQRAVDWYLDRKKWKRLGARGTRFLALVLALLAGLVPLVGEINESNGMPALNPLWGSVALVLAAGAVAIDRLFGFSSGYMRYLSTAMILEGLAHDFSVEWQLRRATMTGLEPNAAHIQEGIEACRRFCASIGKAVQSETESWVQEFTSTLAEIDKSAKAQVEKASSGAINVSVTNADQASGGWELIVDGGSAQPHTGKTAAIRGLVPGTHSISIHATIDGVRRSGARNVIVSSGSVVELEMSLD
ncbi:SLATT domain-containing protein [Sinorhizobium meliloti]|uniref:SLATT domain-containing protein n=1 Tax=Rhizobium meliloti TaxID=382 RepID=UPI00299DFCC9|nr:SLATT domain-containing protein [Sinorhizobium meliloti]MDW9919352.1 SLATT domain-containing protein [Sinorhizobium meliloti]MDX0035694.1 SLATT domain-containing protein [Sinorhizobium meliloti]MDX0363072.1 SLATT domain-containing protein [Sinorhizobium meliloti]